jgi:plastocyanin domain-containing protein
VNWTALRGTQRAQRSSDGTQEARVVVDRGYRPSRIELAAGVPTVLRFERREDDPCTELLVSELWPSAHRLAAHGETAIRFTPQRPGRYPFTCGMGMYSGEIVVQGGKN